MKQNWILSCCTAALAAALLAGCSSGTPKTTPSTPPASPSLSAQVEATPASKTLEGQSLQIFCGAGMKAPFEEIAKAFEEESGCKLEVTYANAAQIQTQINTAQEGDFFIAGSEVEVKPVKDLVENSTPLVRHIPVIAVQKGNPKEITSVADLGKDGVRVVIGDPEATPIGKIATKVFEDFKLTGQVEIVSNTATAPAMSLALASDECDAILVWKENVDAEKADIVDTPDMESYIKAVPAARLTCSDDTEAADVFLTFLNGQTAHDIWTSHGYELAKA